MPTAFLLTPFSPETAGEEDPLIFERVRDAIAEAATAASIDLRRADDIFAGGIIVEQIRGAIESADVVIAVCTGRNANVFYELGLAEILGHKPILLAGSSADLPSDWRHWRAHLYGGDELDSLADRLRQAIEETIAARSEEPALTAPEPRRDQGAPRESPREEQATEESAVTTPRPLSTLHQLLRDDDRVTFNEELKHRIRAVAEYHAELARVNESQQPTSTLLEASAPERYALIDDVVKWIVPTFEYRADWCDRQLQATVDWWARRPTEADGFTLWSHFHQAWIHPLLSTLFAAAIAEQQWHIVEVVLSLRTPGDANRRGDSGQLLIGAEFIWPEGLGGNAVFAFDEWQRYLEFSRIAEDVLGANATIELACGTNLVMGLARCVFQAEDESRDGDPYILAAFAAYYCDRIRWAASRVDTSEVAARALGAESLEQFRAVAEQWYPRLIQQRDQTKHLATCRTWPEAAGRRG